ncbi:Roundabout 1 [Tyrophagus putrescentiae]|nr:Roundabout 1 [Tyrophagus putrescentiae]
MDTVRGYHLATSAEADTFNIKAQEQDHPQYVNTHYETTSSASKSPYKDNELVHKSPNYIFLGNGDLFILKVTNDKKEKNTGVYHCVASNEHGRARSHNATVEIAYAGRYQCLAQNLGGARESPPAQLNVRVKPFFVRKPEDVIALSNEAAEIHCKVGGDPLPKVTWRREGNKIPTSRTIFTEDKSIRISHVTEEDEGVYVCEAENLVGQISSSASLIVHSRPNFLIEPKDIRANVNGVARFECVATGNPRPSVFWTKEGNQILMFPDNKYGRFSVTSDGSLLVSSVKREDVGFYICSALSVVGSSTAKAFLNVSSSADIPPPLIILGPINQTLAQGTRALSDSGIYQCAIHSENGQSSWSATLRVAPAHSTNTMFHRMPDPSTFPNAPSRPSIVNSTESSITISWRRVGRDGASPVIATIIEYFSPDHHNEWLRVAQPVTGEVHTVHGLKSGSRYYFIVRAQNSHGIGPPSAISNEARTLGSHEVDVPVSSNLVDSIEARHKLENVVVELKDVRAINSSMVKLFWEVRGNQEFVEGFYIRYRAVDSDNFASDENTYNMVTVYNGGATTYLLTNLPKYNIFEFFVVPFYKSIDGKPSNTRIVRTLEDVPSAPPNSIKAQPVTSSSALVSWQPPPPEHLNGMLLGYKLFVQGTYTPYNINLTINANTTSYLLRNLSSETEYVIQILAFTTMGNGPPSSPLTFIMDPLLSDLAGVGFDATNMSNVWICVLIITLIILSLIVLLLGVLLYKKRNSILKKGNDGLTINREMKSQNSSLYPSQWQYSWKTSSRQPMDAKQITGINNTLKISSSFHPSDQNGYSTVTTDEQAADYAEVSQTDNNYETAYYASSNGIASDSPVAYASSSIISAKNNAYNTTNVSAWPNAGHNWTTQIDSSVYSTNVTQIPPSKLITNQYKYGSLSRASPKANHSNQSQLNSLAGDCYGKKQSPFEWESSRDSSFALIGQPSPRSTLNRNTKSRVQMEIEATYKPSAQRHIISNPLIERHANFRSPSYGDSLDEASRVAGKGPVHYFTLKDKAQFNKAAEPAINTLTSCDNESGYQELP